MDVGLARDWVVIIVGSLGIVVLIVFLIMALLIFRKIINLINKIKRISNQIESVITSPFYQMASMLSGIFAEICRGTQKK